MTAAEAAALVLDYEPPEVAQARRFAQAQAILARRGPAREDLVAALGTEAAARGLGLTPAAVERLLASGATHRRRLCDLLRERLGVEPERAPEVAALARAPEALAEAAYVFALAIEVARAPRVLDRAAFARLVAAYGEDAVAFALERRAALREAPDAGRGDAPAPAVRLRAPVAFAATLAAAGEALAGPIALVLGLPWPILADASEADRAALADPARVAAARAALDRVRPPAP